MRARGLLAIFAVVAACDPGASPTGTGTGGASGTGGATSTGGEMASGGASAAGGSRAGGRGGTSSLGGTVGSGGTTGTGGATASGGSTASGGDPGAGGRAGTGGTTVPGSDAGRDSGRRDGGLGGSGGVGGSGGGGAGGAGGGTGGARPDAGIDARPDASPEVAADLRADTVASDGRTTSDGAPCPHAGGVTYTLTQNSNASAAEQAAYPIIRAAMDEAVYYYNCYTDITKKLTVSYNSSVQTADGNINGSIRFGPNTSYMERATAMHEIGHTVGIGTASNWMSFLPLPDGGGTRIWTGANATAELRAITGNATDVVNGDSQHFWPYGLNYASEWHSEADGIAHCRMVAALRQDMGNP